MALRLWLDPTTTTADWLEPIWPVVILSLISIVAFTAHVLSNKSLEPGENDYWITRFLIMNVIGMLEYWWQHVVHGRQV